MKIGVSACLLGINCKYNGKNNLSEKVQNLVKNHEVFPICPEVLGGLSTPREPSEIVNGVVYDRSGHSVDNEFRYGAQKALQIMQENKVDLVILQSRSPSCGTKQIYDGTFSGKLIHGQGIFVQLLNEHGIKVMDVEDL